MLLEAACIGLNFQQHEFRMNGPVRIISYDAAGQAIDILEQIANTPPIAWLRHYWNPNTSMNWEFAAPLPHTNSVPTCTMTIFTGLTPGGAYIANRGTQGINHGANGIAVYSQSTP